MVFFGERASRERERERERVEKGWSGVGVTDARGRRGESM